MDIMNELLPTATVMCSASDFASAISDVMHVLALDESDDVPEVRLSKRDDAIELACLTRSQIHASSIDGQGQDIEVQLSGSEAAKLHDFVDQCADDSVLRIVTSHNRLWVSETDTANGVRIDVEGFVEPVHGKFGDELVRLLKTGEYVSGGVEFSLARLAPLIAGGALDDNLVLAVASNGIHYRGVISRDYTDGVYVVGYILGP